MALAAPEWRTVWSVVLPTARSGLVTSVLLGVAVSIGETAPLIMTIFGNQVMNSNPLRGPQMALSLLSYKQIKLPIQSQIDLGYTSALVLFILVFAVFILARILAGGVGRSKRAKKGMSLSSRLAPTMGVGMEISEDAAELPNMDFEIERDQFGDGPPYREGR